MPRPVKWRKVSFIPGACYLPAASQYELEEVVLKLKSWKRFV